MIDRELYSKMHELLPIVCLDLVVMDQDNRVLLIKRNRKPAEGQYWFPGGRIFRDESFIEAAKRLLLGETNINIDIIEMLGVDNLMFPDDPFGHGKGTHTVTCIAKCVPVTTDVKIDLNHDHFIWWHPAEKMEGKNVYGLDDYVTTWSDKALGL